MYTRNNGITSFNYDVDELFDLCALESSYMSKNIKNDKNEYNGEYLVLTRDEQDAFGVCLENGIDNLLDYIQKLCPDNDGINKEDGFSINVYDGNSPDKILKIVDSSIKYVIIYGALSKWYALNFDSKTSDNYAKLQEIKLQKLWKEMFRMRNIN